MSSGRLNIAHLFQSSNLRFHEPIAAQLHMYYTIHELQKAGHRVALLTMQRRRAIYTEALDVFRSSELPDCSFGRLGLC